MSNDRDMALAAGGDDFDTKPVRFDQLLAKIETLLAKGAGAVTRPRIAAPGRRQRDRIATRCRAGCAQRGFDVTVAADGRRGARARRARRRSISCCSTWRCPGMSGLEVLAATARRRARGTALPVIMVTARTEGRRHRRGLPPRRQRLRDQADRFPGRAGADRHAPVAQVGGRGACARARSATRSRCRAPTTASGTGTSPPTRSTGRGGGRRCWATTSRRSATSPEEWFSRVHPDDARRVSEAGWPRTSDGRAATTSPSTGCSHQNGTFRWFLCRGAAIRNDDRHGDAAGRIAHRHHRRQARGRA